MQKGEQFVMTKIFGHRGAAGTFPENTMISFKHAAEVGADGIELDVQLSKDGEIIVMHDEMVNRTTNGKGWVKDLTYSQIKKLDASYKFTKQYGNCPVPTLADVFSWAKTNKLLINVELKNSLVEYKGLEEKVIKLIHQFGLSKRIILSSFNHYSMVKCVKIDSTIETAILYMEKIFNPWEYALKIGVKAIHPYRHTVTKDIVLHANSKGVPIRPFTLNDPVEMKKFISYRCNAIITDYPEKALAIIKGT